jgi:hypothetical protein
MLLVVGLVPLAMITSSAGAATGRDASLLVGWLARDPAGLIAKHSQVSWIQPAMINCPAEGQPAAAFGAILASGTDEFINVGTLGVCNYPDPQQITYLEGAFGPDGTMALYEQHHPVPGDRMHAFVTRHTQLDPYYAIYLVISVQDRTQGSTWSVTLDATHVPLSRTVLAGAGITRAIDQRTGLPIPLGQFSKISFHDAIMRIGAARGDFGSSAFSDIKVRMYDPDGTLAASPGALDAANSGFTPHWLNP